MKKLKNKLIEFMGFIIFVVMIMLAFMIEIRYSDNIKDAVLSLKKPTKAVELEIVEESAESEESEEMEESQETKDAMEQLCELYGISPDKPDNEKQDEINAILSDRARYIKIDTRIFMTEDDSSCELNIGNDPENDVEYIISIVMDDTNEEIYHSGLLSPGFYIGKTKLNVKLKEGNYPCTVFFKAYEPETQIEIGQIVKRLDIIVNKNDDNE